MSDVKPIKPSPALLAATRRALEILLPHWPNKLAFLKGSSQADQSMVEAYASACSYAHVDFLEDAAHTWLVNNKFAPQPAEFGAIARQVTPAPDLSVYTAHQPPAPSLAKHGRTVQRLYAVAVERLHAAGHRKYAAPISQIWALLNADQPSNETRAMVRAGDVSEEVWHQVIDAWLSGRRPRAHPMNNVRIDEAIA